VAEAMIKKISLPSNLGFPGCVPLPAFDHFLHSSIPTESGQKMKMIRHQEEQMNVPLVPIFIETDCIEKGFSDARLA
jgi:hypothetical protein